MTNILELLQKNIGKKMSESPSPFAVWLDGTLLDAQIGELTVSFEVRPEMTNPMGLLHGGAIAAICDEMIGSTVYTMQSESFFTSINLNIDFLRGAKKGDTVVAKSKIVRKGKRIINGECLVYNTKNEIVAKASSNLIAL
ncbi:MAG: PaaI family thioesterase [Bacteroidetes bacterium]|nr:MAG: PaaI family thioesterase [Bacteroidota bacterium]